MITFAKLSGTRQMTERTLDGSLVTVAGDWDITTLQRLTADLRAMHTQNRPAVSLYEFVSDFRTLMRDSANNVSFDPLTRAHCLTMAVWLEEEMTRILTATIVELLRPTWA